ncbi:hypothetical protein AHF37_08599 [Paragonimus kellicotti]|nr:hypothetical protein AHF37_08599 [Paragonimus kellicotti]
MVYVQFAYKDLMPKMFTLPRLPERILEIYLSDSSSDGIWKKDREFICRQPIYSKALSGLFSDHLSLKFLRKLSYHAELKHHSMRTVKSI